tara:strand:+ start:100 stop:456 length:357 start_codon:yes stop_codon:yes gene_type:complete
MDTRRQLDVLLKSELEKEISPILDSLDKKQRKELKKTIQSAEPSEYFGQDFTKLGELIDMMTDLELVKSDKKISKKVESMRENNTDMVATAAKLRKTYEQLYEQLRSIVYPGKSGDLR